jgi:hypothetical protein
MQQAEKKYRRPKGKRREMKLEMPEALRKIKEL